MEKSAIVAVLMAAMVLAAGKPELAMASCTVKNTSPSKVIIVPTVDVSVNIEVDVGASIELPKHYQTCYFKNADTGKQQGPFTLTDGSVVACVSGRVSGTVDIYATTKSLVSAVLSIFSCLPIITVCVSL